MQVHRDEQDNQPRGEDLSVAEGPEKDGEIEVSDANGDNDDLEASEIPPVEEPQQEVPVILVELTSDASGTGVFEAEEYPAQSNAEPQEDQAATAVVVVDYENYADSARGGENSYTGDEEEEEEEEAIGFVVEVTGSSGRASDPDGSLLGKILAEPWFRRTNVARVKVPVVRALLELMDETGSSEDHGQMCSWIVDVKRQLGMDADFESELVAQISGQLESLIADLFAAPEALGDEETWPGDLESFIDLTRIKGENLLDLLRYFSYDIAGLYKRWTGALLTAALAIEGGNRCIRNRRPRRHRRHHPDSGLGTESSASDDLPPPISGLPPRSQSPLVPLTEERLTTAATSRRSPGDQPLEDFEDEADKAIVPADEEVQFAPKLAAASERHVKLSLPLMSPSPRSTEAEARELSVFDLMGDVRLKRMVQRLPKIEQMDLEAISERSRQAPISCPRLVNHMKWFEHHNGILSDRADRLTKPDATCYFPLLGGAPGNGLRDLRRQSSLESLDSQESSSLNSLNSVNAFRFPGVRTQLEAPAERRERKKKSKKKKQNASVVRKQQEQHQQQLRLPDLLAQQPSSARASELWWDGHCRMERLARHGMHRAGVPIGRFLDRDAAWR